MSIIVCPNSLSFSLSALSISCGNTALEASVFPHSSDASYIYSTVKQTLETPDVVSLHKKIADRRVYKKTFSMQVGVHGTSHTACHCVTVIFDIRKNKIITAFPTV